MTLKTNREKTNDIFPRMKFIPDASSLDFTSEQAQAINSININFNPIERINNIDFKDSKKEKQFNYEYQHWAANKKVMDIINEREKSGDPSVNRKAAGNHKTRKLSVQI